MCVCRGKDVRVCVYASIQAYIGGKDAEGREAKSSEKGGRECVVVGGDAGENPGDPRS